MAQECDEKYFHIAVRNQKRDIWKKTSHPQHFQLAPETDTSEDAEIEGCIDARNELTIISKTLSPIEQRILAMKFEGYQYREIGHELGITPELARQLFSRNVRPKALKMRQGSVK